jgi:Ni/Fe-hydrogenase subunit HybB-like protein
MVDYGSSNRGMKGRIFTVPFCVLLSLSLAGLFFVGVRFSKGIGAVSNLSDGYPWGIWVAYDVAIGTAVACGGYAVAILGYILNRGEYHRLVGSAVLTSLFGSCLAAFSVVVDVGRPWNAYGFFVPTRWQPTSALFELLLCLAGYLVALGIEFLPELLATLGRRRPALFASLVLRLLPRPMAQELCRDPGSAGALRSAACHLRPRLNRALICLVLAGLVLPTMHQSALGSLMLIASTKLHSLWHSPFLPLLFLINCIYIGFAMVILESILSCYLLEREYQRGALAALAGLIPWLACAWMVIRVADLLERGQLPAVFHGDMYSLFFLAEFFLMALGPVSIFGRAKSRSPRRLFLAGAMMLAGGALYRCNVYLTGFNPGSAWHYFPSFAEVMISVGIVSLELLGYQLLLNALQ